MGGTGKTQTALAYCQGHKGAYKFVFWIGAATDASVQQGYAEIAHNLGLPGTMLSEQEHAAAARLWLEKHADWLLVLDNLDNPERNTLYFPPTPRGHVLITTRLERLNLPDAPVSFALKPLTPQDSLTFFLRRCQREEAAPPERAAAAELAEQLGYLPLAMEQAAAYIKQNTRFDNYLTLYKKRGLEMLNRTPPGMDASEVAVATTWEINFQAIEKEARQAQTAAKCTPELLRFRAFLAPDAIPLELIQRGAHAFSSPLNELFAHADDEAEAEEICNEALEPLTRYSLADRQLEARTFSLHRLVQVVTRERLSEAEREEWQGRVIRAISSAFPEPDFERWPLCERLLPHAVVVGERIFRDRIMTAEAARLLENTGRYLFVMDRYALVDSCYQAALEIRRQILPEDHLDFAASLKNLGLLRHSQKRCEAAEAHYQQSLAIKRQHLSDNHIEIVELLNNLAGVYDSQGLHTEAEAHYLRALQVTRQLVPPENKYSVYVLNNLGLLYYHQDRPLEAEKHYREALTVCGKRLPANHPHIATTSQNLAELYRNQKRREEAELLYHEALSIQQQIYPGGHSPTRPSLTTTWRSCMKRWSASAKRKSISRRCWQ